VLGAQLSCAAENRPGIADIVDFIPDDCRGAFYRGEMENQGRQDDDKVRKIPNEGTAANGSPVLFQELFPVWVQF
jgi:hypothetical protein